MQAISSRSIASLVLLGLIVFGVAFYFTYVREQKGEGGREGESTAYQERSEGRVIRQYKNNPQCDGVIHYEIQEALQHKDSTCILVLRDIRSMYLEVNQLKNLSELVVRSDEIKVIPDFISELPYLEAIDVAGSENLRAFQADLFTMKSLRTLNVAGTAIKSLPIGIERLNELEKLAVHEGQFSDEVIRNLERALPQLEVIQLDPELIFKQ